MGKVIGVQFQKNGKMYFFDPGALVPAVGEYVIADTVKGIDLAEVVMEVREMELSEGAVPLKRIVRLATAQDIQRASDNRVREQEAYVICQKKIAEHQLEMKLVSTEFSFDGSKVLFYFTANGRVDFRSLVKDLASVFKTRIELRQIGVRDEARMLGGLGPCGRAICCGTFLNDFQPVSIRMAKEQNLSLNPTKISGVCGRLMCCLKYEQEHYEQTRKRMPRVGREVITPDGTGTVTDLNIVKETVSVRIMNGDTGEIKEYPLESIQRDTADSAGTRKTATSQVPEPEEEPQSMENEEALSPEENAELELLSEEVDLKEAAEKTAVRRASERKKPPRERSAAPKTKPEEQKKLGQPVRRENPNRASAQPVQAERPTEQSQQETVVQRANPAAAPAETQSAVPSPAPVKSRPASNWAAQLEQKMKEIEG